MQVSWKGQRRELEFRDCGEIPGLISFRMDCLGLLAVQGTLKSQKLQNMENKMAEE